MLCKKLSSGSWDSDLSCLTGLPVGPAPEANFCVPQNAHYLRCFSVPRVLLRPAGIDRRCQVISCFRRQLGLTDTLGLKLMLVSIRCQTRWILDYLKLPYCEFQKYEVMTMSAEGGQPKRKKHAKPSYKTAKHIERSFLISDYYQLQVTVPCVPCTFKLFQPFPQTQTRALALPLCISFVSTIIFV